MHRRTHRVVAYVRPVARLSSRRPPARLSGRSGHLPRNCGRSPAAFMEAETLTGWLEAFAALHRRAKEGSLSADEKAESLECRDELAEAMLLAQQMGNQPGQGQRKSLRVAQALPVELESPRGRMLAVTLDLSAGGFSTIVSDAPEVGTRVGFKLKLGCGAEPITGLAKVVNA